ncbi:MAG: 16S rRNA processing protein RimM [Desulfitobacterium sp.]|nr:16S rRNA processing protein RimM [Desulfitobacterium sp.]
MDEVLIGEITKPHGIKGELKVRPITDFPERFKKLQEVILVAPKGTKDTFKIKKANVQGTDIYLALDGVNSRDEAEKLRGMAIKIKSSEVPPLGKGRYYYFELEGMEVYEGDNYLGILTQILETGANDVYLVKGPQGEICVPALKTVVKKVDVPGKRMDVILPPGLLDK